MPKPRKSFYVLRDFNLFTNLTNNAFYPYDWRSKKPVSNKSYSTVVCSDLVIKTWLWKASAAAKFCPKRAIQDFSSFIKSRNEWCMAYKRSWGIPILSFYKKSELILLFDEL